MEFENTIVSDPEIMMGKPVVAGTRITVELILDKIAHGESFDDIILAHPSLTEKDIRAAVAFAAANLQSVEFLPILKRAS